MNTIKPRVTLIDYNRDAIDILLYTKQTRLTQGADTRARVAQLSPEERTAQLKYMAETVPSSWEFISYTFEIADVTRAFTHQLVRTRTGSYAQQAMRIQKMEQFKYATGPTILADPRCEAIYNEAMGDIQQAYDRLIAMGAAVEDARGILPTNICTNIIARFNLRALSDLIRSRSSKRVQSEYRDVVDGMVATVLEVHPWASDFITPERLAPIAALQDKIMATDAYNDHEKTGMVKQLDLLRKLLA